LTSVAASPFAVAANQYRHEWCWRIWDDRDFTTPQQGVARDRELGLAVANGAPPTYRLWVNRQSIAISRQDTRLPEFADAAAAMAAAGWPVLVRETGGSAVALDPGILNLSMVLPRSLLADQPGTSLELVYSLLCQPIRQALSTLNIHSAFDSVPGAFCDGRFNLVVNGKKIAGTAQVWRGNRGGRAANGGGYVMAQAALLVDVDPQTVTEAVNRFYRLAGKPTRFASTDIISLRECISRRDQPAAPTSSLVDRIRETIFNHCERSDGEIRLNFS
jgi:octanoyl-[GcvH]:protein N-octanoyltransferase